MSERPKICQVLHGMTVGGAEVLAERLARQFSDSYDMHFLCLDQIGELGSELQRDGFSLTCLDRQPGVDIGCTRRLSQEFSKRKIDLVLAHQYTPFFYSAASRVWGGGPPIMFVEHGRALPDYPRRKRMIFNRWMTSRKDRFIGVGADVRRALIENEGLPEARVEVIYNGVNLIPIREASSSRNQVRSELGFDDQDFVIIQVARLDYLKDHLTAIRTMSSLVEQVPTARLLLVGEGEERTAIEQEIEKRSLQDHVQLLGLRQDVPRLLSSADVMLLTSVSEGIPLTLIEGMAAQLPIVSTQVGGIPEVVSAETALLAPAGDAVQLASHLSRLASDSAAVRNMGQAGFRVAFERFSEEVMHAQYERVFAQMLGTGTPPKLKQPENVTV